MLNKVLLIGNTTRAIELRYLPSGSAVAKTGLAVNRAWKDKNTGEKKDETMFIDIVIYGKSAEIANQYLLKGKKVLAVNVSGFQQSITFLVDLRTPLLQPVFDFCVNDI